MIAEREFEGKKYRKVDSFREMDAFLRKQGASTIITIPKTDGKREYYTIDGYNLYIRIDSTCYEYKEELYLYFKTAKQFTGFVKDEYGELKKIKINHITNDYRNNLRYCDILICLKDGKRFTYKISISDVPEEDIIQGGENE